MSSIIQNIELLINNKGLKKKSVAMRAGYTEQQFSNLVNGRKTRTTRTQATIPTLSTLFLIFSKI